MSAAVEQERWPIDGGGSRGQSYYKDNSACLAAQDQEQLWANQAGLPCLAKEQKGAHRALVHSFPNPE